MAWNTCRSRTRTVEMTMLDELLRHWPFAAAVAVFMLLGQAMKARVFTYEAIARHDGNAIGWLLWQGRKTLPFHPVVTGLLAGAFVPGLPVSVDAEAPAAVALYYSAAGVVAVFGFDALKGFLKDKGVKLSSLRPTPPV